MEIISIKMVDKLSASELEAQIEAEMERLQAKLMVGYKPPRLTFTELGGTRVYIHRDTEDREVRDGKVWCLRHEEQLREYADKRGTVQRKCRSCGNEYQRAWSRGTAKGVLNEARRNATRRSQG